MSLPVSAQSDIYSEQYDNIINSDSLKDSLDGSVQDFFNENGIDPADYNWVNKLTDKNSTLLLEVYKLEGIAVLYESLPFVWAHVSQVGITKGKSDNSDSIENNDIAYLNTHIKAQLDYAKSYLREWLDEYAVNFPLYKKEEDCCKTINESHLDIYSIKKDDIDII